MLLDNFYSVQDLKTIDANTIEFTVELDKDHAIYKGHFPKYPVTPGVAMLQIIKNGLENHLLHPLLLQSSSNIKFLNLVNPEEETIIVFHLHFTIEDQTVKVKNTTSFKDGRSVLKCNVTF